MNANGESLTTGGMTSLGMTTTSFGGKSQNSVKRLKPQARNQKRLDDLNVMILECNGDADLVTMTRGELLRMANEDGRTLTTIPFGEVKMRDLRTLDPNLSFGSSSKIMPRTLCLMVNLNPVSAFITPSRIYVIIENGADAILQLIKVQFRAMIDSLPSSAAVSLASHDGYDLEAPFENKESPLHGSGHLAPVDSDQAFLDATTKVVTVDDLRPGSEGGALESTPNQLTNSEDATAEQVKTSDPTAKDPPVTLETSKSSQPTSKSPENTGAAEANAPTIGTTSNDHLNAISAVDEGPVRARPIDFAPDLSAQTSVQVHPSQKALEPEILEQMIGGEAAASSNNPEREGKSLERSSPSNNEKELSARRAADYILQHRAELESMPAKPLRARVRRGSFASTRNNNNRPSVRRLVLSRETTAGDPPLQPLLQHLHGGYAEGEPVPFQLCALGLVFDVSASTFKKEVDMMRLEKESVRTVLGANELLKKIQSLRSKVLAAHEEVEEFVSDEKELSLLSFDSILEHFSPVFPDMPAPAMALPGSAPTLPLGRLVRSRSSVSNRSLPDGWAPYEVDIAETSDLGEDYMSRLGDALNELELIRYSVEELNNNLRHLADIRGERLLKCWVRIQGVTCLTAPSTLVASLFGMNLYSGVGVNENVTDFWVTFGVLMGFFLLGTLFFVVITHRIFQDMDDYDGSLKKQV